MKNICVKSVAVISVLSLCVPLQALAVTGATVDKAPHQVSYERERTDAEWRTLRDNNLEWDEIQDLVHEYNPTISKAWLSFRNSDNEGAFNISYDDAIQSIEDTYDATLSQSTSDLTDAFAEFSRSSSYANVDTSLQNNDREVNELSLKRSELQMTEAIQEQVIAVYTTQLTTQLNQLTSDYDKTLIGKTERQLATGQATELDLLTAQKTSKDADIALTSAQAAEVKAKQSLLVNLGWAYNATPTICAVPDVTDAMINSIDLTADTTKALGNSFQLQVDERKQNVSVSDSSIAQMALTVDNDKNQVQSDIMSAYNALINAKNDYAKAQLQESNLNETLAQTQRAFTAGTASQRELEAAQYNASAQTINTALSKYALQKSYFSYLATRDGLAGGSASA